ncbi:hypothetical protein [Paenibacillus hexagrammi]|uniref:Uncharacterized protein n=1 Tax=Paenibacillus hexagrammi TaxID=2908839 RepID=A0ABY3SJ38_9BACL|nr:hypothetical protein [Paenibacillus sp. YPD9-1]UJF32997.1 hypothetical protein L0M14_26040 [Paenibacillus sp. YPD9-1]
MTDTILKSEYRSVIHKWIKKIKRRDSAPANKREAAKTGLNLPFEEVGCGSRRIVYDLGNGYILKVAIIRQGIVSCQKETDIYERVPLPLKQNLAEIKEYGEGWIVMKKFGRMLADTAENRRKVYQLYKEFKKLDIEAGDIINMKNKEPRWHNIRYKKRNDRIMLIDYGDFHVK